MGHPLGEKNVKAMGGNADGFFIAGMGGMGGQLWKVGILELLWRLCCWRERDVGEGRCGLDCRIWRFR